MELLHLRLPLPQGTLHPATRRSQGPKGEGQGTIPAPGGPGRRLSPHHSASPPAGSAALILSQVLLPALPPGDLLCINLHFRACLLRDPAQGKPCFVTSHPRPCNFLFSEALQRTMRGQAQASKSMQSNPQSNPHGHTWVYLDTGSSRDKDNMQTNVTPSHREEGGSSPSDR